MAIVLDHPVDDEHAEVLEGRPDLHGDHRFGVVKAKKHPPFVFSVRGVSCLIHKVAYVDLHWWRVARGGHALAKLKRPAMVAHTNCSMFFHLEGERSRTCHIPNPDALLCGRCHGDVATFGANGEATKLGIRRQDAHVKLGCVIQGY